MSKEIETIDGFDIIKRELTEEEATREITLERFSNFHIDVGEDFVDQFTSIDEKVLGGFLMAKRPEISHKIVNVLNDKYSEALTLEHLYSDELADDNNDLFYTDLAEFINLTVHLKKRVNQVLIQVDEHYNEK